MEKCAQCCFLLNVPITMHCSKNVKLTSVVFGMVPFRFGSLATLKFSFRRSTFFNSISIITDCTCANVSESNITMYANNYFTFLCLQY
jgi:hypothetical protein